MDKPRLCHAIFSLRDGGSFVAQWPEPLDADDAKDLADYVELMMTGIERRAKKKDAEPEEER